LVTRKKRYMKFFNQDFIKFFEELTKNNNRDWFHSQKKRYETSVKLPFAQFVQEIINRIHDQDQTVTMEAKEAIFRINRDIRFSKDKSPYKTHMAAIVSSGGKKDMTTPGIYLQLSAEDARLYSGVYMADKNQIQQMREHIASHLDEFDQLINQSDFKKKFGEIHGEKNKRLPKEFQELEKQQPLIANKSFYYFAKFKPQEILKENFADTILNYYKTTFGLKGFFTEALVK